MSYSYNQRKKTIKRFKKKFGKSWFNPFCEFVEELKKKKLGKLIGTLAEVRPTHDR